MDPLHTAAWKGLDNVRSDLELPDGFARNAVNVDFTAGGKVAVRSGSVLLSAGEARSGVAFDPYILFVRSGVIRAYHTRTAVLTSLGLSAIGDRLGSAIVRKAAYLSDGLSKWKINLDLTVSAWKYPAVDDPTFDMRFVRPMPACPKMVYFQGRIIDRKSVV